MNADRLSLLEARAQTASVFVARSVIGNFGIALLIVRDILRAFWNRVLAYPVAPFLHLIASIHSQKLAPQNAASNTKARNSVSRWRPNVIFLRDHARNAAVFFRRIKMLGDGGAIVLKNARAKCQVGLSRNAIQNGSSPMKKSREINDWAETGSRRLSAMVTSARCAVRRALCMFTILTVLEKQILRIINWKICKRYVGLATSRFTRSPIESLMEKSLCPARCLNYSGSTV
ncbi:MAG: hypothetical protein AAB864_02715 [Patescibacteria group bacterium]